MVLADGVESANTVGYTEKAITGDQWYMIGVQFEEVGGEAATIALDDLIQLQGVTACAYDNQSTDAAQIQYFNGSIYDLYYYISDAYIAGTEDEVGKDCWARGGETTTATKFGVGEGFWFKAPANAVGANAKMTVKGEVAEVKPTQVAFAANTWKIVSNPFPTALGLQNVTTTGVTACAYDNQGTDAAQIQYFDGSVYQLYYYISDAYIAGTEDEIGYDTWARAGDACSGTQIPVGEAFWIKSPTAGSLTISL